MVRLGQGGAWRIGMPKSSFFMEKRRRASWGLFHSSIPVLISTLPCRDRLTVIRQTRLNSSREFCELCILTSPVTALRYATR